MNKVVDINKKNNIEIEYLVKFNKPYIFEGQEYTELDLSGLEDLTAKDMTEVDQQCLKNGIAYMQAEMSLPFLMRLAAKASKKPLEFFDNMKIKESTKVKNRVMSFLYSMD